MWYLLILTHEIASNMLDVPNFFWESEPTLYPLYIAVREYLEIKPRIQVLNERCRVFLDLTEILSDSIADNTMSRTYIPSLVPAPNPLVIILYYYGPRLIRSNISRSNLDHHHAHPHLHLRHHLRSHPPLWTPLQHPRREPNDHDILWRQTCGQHLWSIYVCCCYCCFVIILRVPNDVSRSNNHCSS